MSNQEIEVVECLQCKKIPDNYLCLNCQHCFCLACMAQNFLRGGRIYQKPETKDLTYICSMCEVETDLDEASVQAIDTILHQILIPCLDQLSQSPQLNQQKIIMEESQENEIAETKSPENLQNEEPRPDLSQIQDMSQHFDSIYAQTPNRNKDSNEVEMNKSHQDSDKDMQMDNFNHCTYHTNEENNLFCFSCETKCFCVKCLIQNPTHRNHDVQNIQMSMKRLRSKMNEANHSISASLNNFDQFYQKKRIIDQDYQNLNQIKDFKNIVNNQFETLIKSITQKKLQITQELSQLQTIQQQQANKLVNEITLKVNTLSGLKNDFQNISVNKSDSLQPSASLFNFFADCKQIMQKVVGQINFSELLQSETTAIKYFPDYKGIKSKNKYSFLEFFFNINEFDDKIKQIYEKIEQINDKGSQTKQENVFQTFRSFSLHEKNWGKMTNKLHQQKINPDVSSLSRRCNTQGDDDDQSRVKTQVSLKMEGKSPDSASIQYYFEKTFSKKQKDLIIPTTFFKKGHQKSILDSFKGFSSYSERIGSLSNKQERNSQKKNFGDTQLDNKPKIPLSQSQIGIMNIKRSYSELSPKLQISPYFKIGRQNPLNVLRQQQGQFDQTKGTILNDAKQ